MISETGLSTQGDRIEEVIRQYYVLVDKEDFSGFRRIFSPKIFYDRCGYSINGLDDMLHFYLHIRKIKGQHQLDRIRKRNDGVIVQGQFQGHNYFKEPIHIRFTDYFRLNDTPLIIYRRTVAPGGFELTIGKRGRG